MKRSRILWPILLGSLALILAAMSWLTQSLVRMENEQWKAESEVAQQENLRLAMWRIDSFAKEFLDKEDQRFPEFSEMVKTVKEMNQKGFLQNWVMPIVNNSNELFACRQVFDNSPINSIFTGKEYDYVGLNGFQNDGNRNYNALIEKTELSESPWGTIVNNSVPVPKNEVTKNVKSQSRIQLKNTEEYQNYNDAVNLNNRAKVFNADQRQKSARSVQLEKKLAKKSDRKLESKPGTKREQKPEWNLKSKSAPVPVPAPEPSPESDLADQVQDVGGDVERIEIIQAKILTAFVPIWLEDELWLSRRVESQGLKVSQLVMMDLEGLKKQLLAEVEDLVPGASLQRIRATTEHSPGVMVTLPLRLVPAPALIDFPEWTPLRTSLAFGWVAVLLACVAVCALLRGLWRLSERRASFVSSVTHELRTPLTTFQLYSDMLAEGMVPADQQKGYLEAMRSESERLGHLVENVLSYSRIEQGSARAQLAEGTVADLISPVLPHIRQRIEQEKGELVFDDSVEAMDLRLLSDATGVGQILFNLVDNACKYAFVSGCEKRLELMVQRKGDRLEVSVRDYGPGVKNGERRRLFRAFHKSAAEAAQTKPGVGLGLSLSRRIARELGGDLVIDRSVKDGVRFVLSLPLGTKPVW